MLKITAFLLVFLPPALFGQITLKPFDMKGESDVEKIDRIEAPVAVSACGDVRMTYEDMRMSGGCAGTLVRTYRFEDDCGATAMAQRFIRLNDNRAPEFVNPPGDMVVSKHDIPHPPQVEALDDGGLDTDIRFFETDSGSGMVRTWIATDTCGNSSTHIQTLTFKDVE